MVVKKRLEQSKLPPDQSYSGVLQFVEDGDKVTVSRFIVRPAEISFDLNVPSLAGEFNFSNIARLSPRGNYVSKRAPGYHQLDMYTKDESEECQFEFYVLNRTSKRIKVKGCCYTSSESYEFDGELSALKLDRKQRKR